MPTLDYVECFRNHHHHLIKVLVKSSTMSCVLIRFQCRTQFGDIRTDRYPTPGDPVGNVKMVI